MQTKRLNWQTQQIKDWLDYSDISTSCKTSAQLEWEVVDRFLVRDCPTPLDRVKNAAMQELFAEVEWSELVFKF